MNLLIVEDREESRTRLTNIIKDLNGDLIVHAASSYTELMGKLLTTVYDLAIVDIDLSLWGDFAPEEKRFFEAEDSIKDGVQIAGLVEKLNNSEKIVLYTGNEKIEYENKNWIMFPKAFRLNFSQDFNNEVFSKLIDPEEPPVPSVQEFQKFSQARKSSFYKQHLSRTNTGERFNHIGNHHWISNLSDNENRPLIGSSFDSSSAVGDVFGVGNYDNLIDSCHESAEIPMVFWNFNNPEFFSLQVEEINRYRYRDKTIDLYFDISLAAEISGYILEKRDHKSTIEQSIELLNTKIRAMETQKFMLSQMEKAEEKPAYRRKMIDQVGTSTGHRILDMFKCSVQEVDIEKDKAWVLLKSMVDPDTHLTREFTYSRLQAQGLRFKESNFYYYVSESPDEGTVTGIVEPD